MSKKKETPVTDQATTDENSTCEHSWCHHLTDENVVENKKWTWLRCEKCNQIKMKVEPLNAKGKSKPDQDKNDDV